MWPACAVYATQAMAAAEADAPAAPAPEPLEEEPAEGEGVIEIAFRWGVRHDVADYLAYTTVL